MTTGHSDLAFIRGLVRERSGIILEGDKDYLIESRLAPLARQEGVDSVGELVSRLRTGSFNHLQVRVVEAMTTNETSFFRDFHPFGALRECVIPEILKRREVQRELHIWCAACSTGQEVYSIAMLLREHFASLGAWTFRLMASDLTMGILTRAIEGRYRQVEIDRGLPAALLAKYFQKQGDEWQIHENIRRMVEFREINLAEAWPPLPAMDIIFLRNVLVYFDAKTKKEVLRKVRRLLRSDGYLFLGGTETTMNVDDSFERIQLDKAVYYQLRER